MAYRIRSFRRLCSATSPGGLAKRASSVVICERRPSIFLSLMISYVGSSKRTFKRGVWSNLVVGINGGDGSKDGFERTGSTCNFLCNIWGSFVTLTRISAAPGTLFLRSLSGSEMCQQKAKGTLASTHTPRRLCRLGLFLAGVASSPF